MIKQQVEQNFKSETRMIAKDKIRHTIEQVFLEVYTRENRIAVAFGDDTVLLDSGLDSLGFAMVVVELEERVGYDPFSMSTTSYYPQTVRQFIDFYEKYRGA